MKKILFFIFSIITIVNYSQEKTPSQIDNNLPENTKRVGRSITIYDYEIISLSSGISNPSSNFSNSTFSSNGNFFEISGSYFFSKIGIGLSIGQSTNRTDQKLMDLSNTYQFSSINSSDDLKISYYGFGPEFKTSFNKIQASFIIRSGIMSIKPLSLTSSFNENIDVAVPIYNLSTSKTSKVSYFSTGIKIGYQVVKNLNLFATLNYQSALSNNLTFSERKIEISTDGTIDPETRKLIQSGVALNYSSNSIKIKPQSSNYGIGLSYTFSAKNKGRAPGSIGAASTPSRRNIKENEKINAQISRKILDRGEAGDNVGIHLKNGDNRDADSDDDGFLDSLEISDGVDNDCDSDTSTTKRMNKGELVDAIAKDAGLSKADAGKALNAIASNLSESLKKGNAVQLIGFGHSILARAARTGRNPQTGATIKTAAKKVAKFKADKAEININNRTFGDGHNADANPKGFIKNENQIDKRLRLPIRDSGSTVGAGKPDSKRIDHSTTGGDMEVKSSSRVIGNTTGGDMEVKPSKSEIATITPGQKYVDTLQSKQMNKGELVDAIAKDANLSNKRTDNSQNPQGNGGPIQMNKGELVDAIAKDANLSKADASNALNAFIASMSKELNSGNCVKLIVPIAMNRGIREGGKTIGAGTNTKRKSPGRTKYSNITLKKEQVNNDTDNDGFSDSLEISDGVDNDCNSETTPTKRMNKGELVDAIAKDAGLSKADAGKALNAITSHLLKSLKMTNIFIEISKDTKVKGFSKSKRRLRIKRKSIAINKKIREGGRTIGARDSQKIAAKKVAKFKAGAATANPVKRTSNSQNPQGNDGEIQMNKGELVDAIAKDVGLSKADAGKALNAFIASMSKELNNENCVKLIVPVAINKRIREGGRTIGAGQIINTNKDNNQQGYTKESTMIFVRVDETSLRNSNTKIPKDNLIQENDQRMSKRTLRAREENGKRVKNQTLRTIDNRSRDKRGARVKARTRRTVDQRYIDKRDARVKARTLRTQDKRYNNKRDQRVKERALRAEDKRYSNKRDARVKVRTLRTADKRYSNKRDERIKARTLRTADKRYSAKRDQRVKARTLRTEDERYSNKRDERIKARTLRTEDKRYAHELTHTVQQGAGIKPVQITTKETNTVNPSTNLDSRFLKAQNDQTIQLFKNKYQLTAPLLNSKDQTELINYNWTVKNKTQNKKDKFTGKSINYDFDVSGTYEIEITPNVNNKNLNSYRITIICN